MKIHRLIYLIIFLPALVYGQIKIKGEVRDLNDQPVTGANVYLLNTYDGTSSDEKGYFEFETHQTGLQELVVSVIGYTSWQEEINLGHPLTSFLIQVKEEPKRLDDLVISAGLFEASDENKSVALRPLDIVTTAGATADIPGVMNTLPGTQTVGEQGRLFIRGGESEETKNFIDGMLVDQAYGLSPGNIPSRMRFSPFLFSGTSFSTGGYSAEYGQALSGTLVLKTDDTPVQTQTDLSLMSVGGSIAHTHKWERRSVFIESAYTDLTPYFFLIPQHTEWSKAPSTWQNTLMYREKLKNNGMVKIFYSNDFSSMSLNQPSWIDVTKSAPVTMKNKYHHLNANYESFLGDSWKLYAGLSGTFSKTDADLNILREHENHSNMHGKVYVNYDKGNKIGLKIGMDHYFLYYQKEMDLFYENSTFEDAFNEWLPGLFIESDFYLTEKLVGRIGLRLEHAGLADQFRFSPRISLAYKTGKFSQISFASGIFSQRPDPAYRIIQPQLNDELAFHYIFNYQWVKEQRTFRIECYHKEYKYLVTFEGTDLFNPSLYSNGGYGFARGIDVFWRDSETFRNVDYWLSYSFLDTERLYENYPEASTPGFASTHNLSLVYKHFIQSIRSQVGSTFTLASPRNYHNPNSENFNSGSIPAYYDLSFNYSYLIRTNLILHFSMTNVLGLDQVFGYQYSMIPDEEGFYESIPVRQQAKRFIFLGLFWTISKDREANQLRNL